MRRFFLALLLTFVGISAYGQKSDKDLLREADAIAAQAHKDTSSLVLRVEHIIRNQLAEDCYYEPECVRFFPQAVKELGFIPAVFATADRATRCTRIGTVLPMMRSDRFPLKEGPEAYRTRRRKE